MQALIKKASAELTEDQIREILLFPFRCQSRSYSRFTTRALALVPPSTTTTTTILHTPTHPLVQCVRTIM